MFKLTCAGGRAGGCIAAAGKTAPGVKWWRAARAALIFARRRWLPEVGGPALLAALQPGDLVSYKRMADRAAAFMFAARELRAMAHHFKGDCM
jgi:hypothetical protein